MAKGGARPGAGRKPYSQEVAKVKDLARCWDIVMQYVNDVNEPLAKRAELASRFAVKCVPEKFEDVSEKKGIALILPNKTKVDMTA